MSREIDRLIVDRGHGLSRRQKDVLGAVARGEVAREYLHVRDDLPGVPYDFWRSPRRVFPLGIGPTVKSLAKRGLVELAPPMRSGTQAWQLTRPDGYTLAAEMGLLSGAGRELTDFDRAECAYEAAMKRMEDV